MNTRKIALVTGAASGIGRATTKTFAADGYALVVCDVDATNLAALVAELGPACVASATVDVADRQAMRAFAERVHAEVGAVDVLVNNAGVGCQGGILDTTLEDWDWVLGINLMGVIHGCHFFVPPMVARGHGHVVNIASVYGIAAGSQVAAYAASKFGVFGMSEAMRAELRPKGVGVTTICPGMINTNIINTSRFVATAEHQKRQRFASQMFQRRGAPPELVARAIASAVKHRKDVVPVSAEAWALYGLKRAAPRLAAKAIAFLERRANKLAAASKA